MMFTTPQGGPLLTSHQWKYTYVTPIDLPHELYVTEVVTIQISIYNWFFRGPPENRTVVFFNPGLIEKLHGIVSRITPAQTS